MDTLGIILVFVVTFILGILVGITLNSVKHKLSKKKDDN